MAATTISRNVWTDGAGSGTVINNAQLQIIYDKVDAVLAGNVTIGGLVHSEGFGTHLFSTGGTGANTFRVRNTTGGTSNKGALEVMADGADITRLEHLSTTHSTASGGATAPNAGRLYCSSGIGFNFEATLHRFYNSGGIIVNPSTNQGSAIFSTGGFSGSYNGIGIFSNVSEANTGSAGTKGTQANTGLSSWLVDVGGVHAGDGAPFTSDAFGIFRRAAGGSWVRGLALGSNGFLAILDGISAGANITAVTTIAAGTQFLAANGSASAPGMSFSTDTDLGFFRRASNEIGVSLGNLEAISFGDAGNFGANITVIALGNRASGTGAVTGQVLYVGRNTSGNGAAGTLGLVQRDSTQTFLWVDTSDNLRINGFRPTEDNSVSDTAGTVVGTQTSSRDRKDIIERFIDCDAALRTILETPIYRFRYKHGHGFQGEEFVGIVTDDAPTFGMDRDDAHPHGKSLNVINAIGFLIAAIQAQQQQIDALTAR